MQAVPGPELSLRVLYDTDMFDSASAVALIERLRRVLVAMAADPSGRLSSIDLLDVGEHDRLNRWGNRAVLTQPVATAVSIPEVFAAHVDRAPEALALTFEGRSLTYRQLDDAANRLAHLLVGHGVGPGQHVALLTDALLEAVIAILATLKTGAAYLPIDPAVPTSRMDYIVADAQPIAALTTHRAGVAAGRFRSPGHRYRRPPP